MSADNGTVVVIEDDPHIADLVDLYLRREGYRVLLAGDGEKGLRSSRGGPLDRHPRRRPARRPRRLRGVPRDPRPSPVPVLFLTAATTRSTGSSGSSSGPTTIWSSRSRPRELVARVRAILRRTREGPVPQDVIAVGGNLEVDLRRREARRAGEVVALTTREFDLLAFLANNVGLALSRQQLLDGVWGTDWYGDERTVDVHVAQLRKKLGSDLPLATVWGVGYRFG